MHNKKKQNSYVVEEKSTRSLETALDLMSEAENEFEEIWFLLTSASY